MTGRLPLEGVRVVDFCVVWAGTFATLMLANLNTLLQIGFALAFGVLLDTFVVRPFLVPTFAILLSKAQGERLVPVAAVQDAVPPVKKTESRPPLRAAG